MLLEESTMSDNNIFIAITYDKYTPAIEAQITRDFLTMQYACPQSTIYCVAPDESPRAALQALDIPLSEFIEQAHTLIRYRSGLHFANRPKNLPTGSEVIDRDLSKSTLGIGKIDAEGKEGYFLPDFSRPYVSDIERLRPPSNNGTFPPNPALLYMWGP